MSATETWEKWPNPEAGFDPDGEPYQWIVGPRNGPGNRTVLAYTAEHADAIISDHKAAQQLAVAVQALRALAKVQYDGTVEGLRRQIETEDWGDVLDIDGTRAAYELTLAVLTPTPAGEQR